MRAIAGALLMCACATPPVVPPALPPAARSPSRDDAREIRDVVARLLRAATASRFAEVHGLLSQALRERYSLDRLARDFAADPSALHRLEGVRAALEGEVTLKGDAAELRLDGGRRLRAVREHGEWKIAALEE